MKKGLRVGLQKLGAVLSAIALQRPPYQPTRPSLILELEPVGEIGKRGKKKRASAMFIGRYVDRTRYPGPVPRQIRAHGQDRECARRLARGCLQ